MPPASYRLVDLSLGLRDEAIVFPGDAEARVEGPRSFVGGRNREYVYALSMSTQAGTHVQGQHYFLRDGKRIDAYPLARFEGPAVVVDCGQSRRLDAELLERELPEGDLAPLSLLFLTGFVSVLLARRAARGGRLLAEDLEDKPGLTLEGARLLLDRGARFLGIDSVGFELYPTDDHAINRLLCEGDVLLLENLTRLAEVPRTGSWLECFPLPLAGVEGAPCRALVKIPLAPPIEPPVEERA